MSSLPDLPSWVVLGGEGPLSPLAQTHCGAALVTPHQLRNCPKGTPAPAVVPPWVQRIFSAASPFLVPHLPHHMLPHILSAASLVASLTLFGLLLLQQCTYH